VYILTNYNEKVGWVSHTQRKWDESIEKQALDWNLQEARKRGRLK
jgi:hypothetical protein